MSSIFFINFIFKRKIQFISNIHHLNLVHSHSTTKNKFSRDRLTGFSLVFNSKEQSINRLRKYSCKLAPTKMDPPLDPPSRGLNSIQSEDIFYAFEIQSVSEESCEGSGCRVVAHFARRFQFSHVQIQFLPFSWTPERGGTLAGSGILLSFTARRRFEGIGRTPGPRGQSPNLIRMNPRDPSS